MIELESCPFEEPVGEYKIKERIEKMIEKSEKILNAGKENSDESDKGH